MDGGVEEPLAAALGALAVAGILGDVGDQASIENTTFPRITWYNVSSLIESRPR
jgi:hypothetical protein